MTTSTRTRLSYPFSHHSSSFCRYFPECAQIRLFATSCSDPAIGQVSLMIRGNAQFRYRLRIRVSIRRAIGAGGLARNSTNFTVRRFLLPRYLTPDRNLRQGCPNRNTLPTGHLSRPLTSITRRRSSMLDPQTYTPQYNPLPRNGRPPTMAHGYSTTRNVRERRRHYAWVSSDSCFYPPAKLGADECHIRSGRNQLYWDSQGIEWLCKRRQECSQFSHE